MTGNWLLDSLDEPVRLEPSRGCDHFIASLERFSGFGEPTSTHISGGVRYFVNEFWTARQRQASPIHEVSYRACFKPQLPAFFIERLTNLDEVVYDPFMGRGTTPIEAALAGRIPYGNDTNPLSRALTEPRINPPNLHEIDLRLQKIPWQDFKGAKHEELLSFYHPETLSLLEGLRSWLLDRQDAGTLDLVDKWIRMVAINRLTGHSQGFFSVYTMPPNQAVSLKSQEKINRKRNQSPPFRDVPALILRKSKSLLSSQRLPRAKRHLLLTKRSNETTEIPDEAVALTVTSPPFLDIVNYEADNWLRCWFMGIDPASVNISQYGSVTEWQGFIRSTLAELARITREGGFVAFEVGEVRNRSIHLEKVVINAAEGLPFELHGVMVNQQNFTKTSNCWGVSNNSAGTNSNRIVLLERR